MSKGKEPTLRDIMRQLKLIKGQLKRQEKHAGVMLYIACLIFCTSIIISGSFVLDATGPTWLLISYIFMASIVVFWCLGMIIITKIEGWRK